MNKNLKNILYQNTFKDKEKEQERNKLLNELGNNLTPAQTLYSSVEDLKKIKENQKFSSSIDQKLKNSTPASELEKMNPYLKGKEEWENDEDFKKALNFVKQVEGGKSNHKADKGGKTNLGITQITYDEYNKKRNLPIKDINNITENEASKIYYEDFWKKSGAKNLKDKSMGLMLFDAAVNHGVAGAKKYYEKSGGDFDKFYQLRKEYYDNRIIEKPNQEVFHKGWISRINQLQKYKKTTINNIL